MCGIAGYFLRDITTDHEPFLKDAVEALNRRGPDFQTSALLSSRVGFGHARLSIIDTSAAANQPFSDPAGRYTIIFNGEIFNYRELKKQFLHGVELKTTSDTEVLLHMFILFGKDCLNHLNGFFAFAVFDNATGQVFLARDRYGIKPLLIYTDEQKIIFASELKAILKFPLKKEIDFNTLAMYLELNYVPGSASILRNVQKLAPGYYATIDASGHLVTGRYYTIPYTPGPQSLTNCISYDEAKRKLKLLVENAVERRLVADVPLGTFLSGGIDSSIVTACAARRVNGLNTFSVGYKDEPYFDETGFAGLVAKKYKTNHTVFQVSNDEMFAGVIPMLDYIDEPFADSSAIAVYVLSKKTRQKVTVALSGDGGDELFAGYNKHAAEIRARKRNFLNLLMCAANPVFAKLPQSRHAKATNFFRQLYRYSEGQRLETGERYWRWCTLNTPAGVRNLFKEKNRISEQEMEQRKRLYTGMVRRDGDMNDVLLADMNLVLPGDMLTKVDAMSMANSLEVRVPLLDYEVVNFAFSLPVSFKIDNGKQKKILKDAFADELPPELLNRTKKGFEVPLLKWMRTGLRALIENELLEEGFVESQGIFDYARIAELKQRIFSDNPGDVHAVVWGLAVFQYWYKKYYL